MDARFDAYEFIAVLTAGLAAGAGCFLLWPNADLLNGLASANAGTIALGLVFAFLLGHMIRVVSGVIEGPIWKLAGGWPTDWVHDTEKRPRLLNDDQFKRLDAKLVALTRGGVEREGWFNRLRESYARAAAAGRNGRIDMFNRTYGMFTALALVLLVLGGLSLVLAKPPLQSTLLLFGFALCVRGAFKAGWNYAQELLIQAMLLPDQPPSRPWRRAAATPPRVSPPSPPARG